MIESTTTFQIEEPTAIAIGKFDGVHRGHGELLSNILKAKEQRLKAAIFTFDMSPEAFFKKIRYKELMTKEEKRAHFEQMGIDYLVEYPFNEESASIDPEQYVKDFLLHKMNGKLIVAGKDLSFGHKGAGDAALLQRLAEELSFEARIIGKICDEEREISSTYVREEVRKGNMEKVTRLLGKPYSISGVIRSGNRIGRTLGLPTLNLYPPEEKLLPPNGVYFTNVLMDGKVYQGVTNIGRKPTVGSTQPMSVETHLFGFDEDAYGKFCQIQLLKFDRPEQKFEDLEHLKKAILDNVLNGKEYFRKMSGN